MSDKAMPVGKIGNVTISRLILGGNQFSGWSHSRDLKYLRDLFKAYATEKNILQTLRLAEDNGINTIISGDSSYLSKYWKEWGGQMQWIAQVHPKTDDVTSDIKRAIDAGAIAATCRAAWGTVSSRAAGSICWARRSSSSRVTACSPASGATRWRCRRPWRRPGFSRTSI